MLVLWSSLSAFAVDWYLESPDRADRSEAAAVEEAAVAAGFDARVVRRFVEGEGWRYIGRIDGFADAASARVAARELSDAIGTALVVIETTPEGVTRLDDVQPTNAPPIVEQEEEDAGSELDRVAKAHGTDARTASLARSGPVRIAYRRTLADGRVVSHLWAARDGAIFTEIKPVDGSVRASRTRVVGNDAVLSVDGGPWTPQDVDRTRETLDELGPAKILPLVLGVGAAFTGRREFGGMIVAGTGEIDGDETQILRFGGDTTMGPIELEVGAKDHLIRKIRFEEGELVHSFSDYRAVEGAQVPFEVVTRRGEEVVDHVRIDALELGADMPAAWFAPIR